MILLRNFLRRIDTLLLALLAYVPFFLSEPGRISADTKAYLYLNPGRLLASATSMWNPDQGFGFVTHQNVGYLFPMGPYFWLGHTLGIPVWISQRFWMGSLLFLAAVGVRRASEEFGLTRRAGWTAGVAYMLSPFILVNIGRTSALLLPWAGLGWMMFAVMRATRQRGWRYPAVFAFIVALTGGVNATSILLVGIGPLLWLLQQGVSRRTPWGVIWATVARIGILSLLVSAWWLVALWLESKFGINILLYTESIPTVSATSSSSEVFRGLGYWYFYGLDHIQPWTSTSRSYVSGSVIPLASFLIPILGVFSAVVVRWRGRTFAGLLVFFGVVVAVGSYPFTHPTPFGSLLKWFSVHTTLGLAMRSLNRVGPIIVLGLALSLGAGYDALRAFNWRRASLWRFGIAAVAMVGLAPFMQGRALAQNISAPSNPPAYVQAMARYLNGTDAGSEVLGIPGLDFGYYQYGAYGDSIWPGLLTRPFITSEVVLQGSAASVNLERALDSTLQDGIANGASIAPIARLLHAGDVLVQYDGQYDRFSQPGPAYIANVMADTGNGLTLVRALGPRQSDHLRSSTFVNEYTLGLPTDFSWPKALAVYKVANPLPIVRTQTTKNPIVVAGDGEGLVEMADLGLLTTGTTNPIIYDAGLTARQRHAVRSDSPILVLTDSNQRRYDSFGTLQSSHGYVMTATEPAQTTNAGLQPNEPFGTLGTNYQTVAINGGVAQISASSYGNPVTQNPEDAPFFAFDANQNSAWETAAFSDATGEWIQVDATTPHRINKVRVLQPQSGLQNRVISSVRVSLSNGFAKTFTLLPSSLSGGQVLSFPRQTTSSIRLTIVKTVSSVPLRLTTGVGFAEITADGFGPIFRTLRLPSNFLPHYKTAAAYAPLYITMSRIRAATVPPRLDPELILARSFALPSSRTFSLRGNASLNPAAPDSIIEALLGGLTGSGTHVTSTTSSTHVVGVLTTGSWNAFDGDASTSWQSAFQAAKGSTLDFSLNRKVSLSSLSLTIINDGRHSLPTSMTLTGDSGSATLPISIPLASASTRRNATSQITLNFPAVAGKHFSLRFDTVHSLAVIDRVSGGINHAPIGIAEVTMPGVSPSRWAATSFDSGCRRGYLAVDGTSQGVRVVGTIDQALSLQPLSLSTCFSSTLTLSPGNHTLLSAPGSATGINIDELALASSGLGSVQAGTSRNAHAEWMSRSSLRARIDASDAGRWVVLGQSYNAGWHAYLDGVDLGTPTLMDGASMAWRLPAVLPLHATLKLVWSPQSSLKWALLASLLGLALVVVLMAKRPKKQALSPLLPDQPHLTLEGRTVGILPLVILAAILSLCISLWALPLLLTAAAWLRSSRRATLTYIALTMSLFAAGALATAWYAHSASTRDFSWPSNVPYANSLVWLALALWALAVIGVRGSDSTQPAPTVVDDEPVFDGRRRGLNIPTGDLRPNSEGEQPPLLIAPSGPWRTLALLRVLRQRRRNPELFAHVVTLDAINQAVGRIPIYNRAVLEIADNATAYAEVLAERGARVTRMRRESALTRRASLTVDPLAPSELAYSPLAIPAKDQTFDVVFATNVLSSVDNPEQLLRELIRVVRVGGSIYLQNVLWYSPYGGRETSPWHLLGGSYARARYAKRNGQQPVHRYGVNFYKLTAGDVARLARHLQGVAIVTLTPRFGSTALSWTMRVPMLRNLLVSNVVLVLERTS